MKLEQRYEENKNYEVRFKIYLSFFKYLCTLYLIYTRIMSLFTDLHGLLLPRLCPVCGKLLMEGEDVVCAFCALGLPRFPILKLDDNYLLRTLWNKAEVRHAFTFLSYNHYSPYHNLIISIKFHGHSDLAIKLGQWAAMEAAKHGFWDKADALVPVPLTRWRQWKRGYNQAEMLARGMAKVTGLPVLNLLKRTKNRTPQSRLKGETRLKNADNIYRAYIPDAWRGKTLVLVDDVMTTGATLGSCAQALHDADENAEICIFPLSYAG